MAFWSRFILGGSNYELIFKIIISYNALIVYIDVFSVYLYFKKYLHVITSVINYIYSC